MIRTDNAPKVRFSTTLGKEPEIKLALVPIELESTRVVEGAGVTHLTFRVVK